MLHYRQDFLEEHGRLRVHSDMADSSILALSKVDIEAHLADCSDCRQVVTEAQRREADLESIKGMIRTELVTHHAKYNMVPPKIDEFIDRLADKFMAKLERDAQARFAQAADAFEASLADAVDPGRPKVD